LYYIKNNRRKPTKEVFHNNSALCILHSALSSPLQIKKGKALLKKWGIEGNYVGVGHLILGYRDCEYPEIRPRKENYIYRI
jgi:hypothetical protein